MKIINKPPDFYAEHLIAFLYGASIFAISFTQLRGGARVGPFEILLVALSVAWILFSIPNSKNAFKFNFDLVPILFFLAILLPVTILSFFLQSNGANFTELTAYILCGIIALISFRKYEQYSRVIVIGIAVAITTYSLYLMLSGNFFSMSGEEVYGSRWRGASKNPNQTSLYSLVGMGLLILKLNFKEAFIPFLLVFMLAVRALSDAFLGGLFIGLFILAFSVIFIHGGKVLKTIGWLILLPSLLFIFSIYFGQLPIFFDSIMEEADEGGGRITLATNGIIAFLHSPIIGHGAGTFSGGWFPFDSSEAHNTLIDFATIGGLLLPIIFYSIFFMSLYINIKKRSYMNGWILSAFLIFSLAHFIGRHPIVWVYWSFHLYHVLQYFYELKQEIKISKPRNT